MSAETDVLVISGYTCPGCGAALTPPGPRTDSWLRCPSCGRPSLPPAERGAGGPVAFEDVADGIAFEAAKIQGPAVPRAADRLAIAVAVALFGLTVVVNAVARSLGADESGRMLVDSATLLAFGALAILLLRSVLRKGPS